MTNATRHEIIIASDNHEAAEFAAWLIEQGHTAQVGTSTGNYVDGAWTSTDDVANEIMRALWDAYCNA